MNDRQLCMKILKIRNKNKVFSTMYVYATQSVGFVKIFSTKQCISVIFFSDIEQKPRFEWATICQNINFESKPLNIKYV